MTDDLRTRIAAVHQAHRWGVFRCSDGYARTCCRCQWREKPDGPTHAEHVADAVIRELGLQQEFSVGDDEGGRTLWLADEEPVTPREGEVVERRWISRWERDE